MSEPFRFETSIKVGDRKLYVFDAAGDLVLGLRITPKARWIQRAWEEIPPAGLAEWLHANQQPFAQAGFNLLRWWHIWPCRECGAPALGSCRSKRDGKPMKYAHKQRNPRKAALQWVE